MTDLVVAENRITAMCESSVAKVRALESMLSTMPQEEMPTDHIIHGGMYSRTITVKAGCILTGALINVPTILIVNGNVTVFANNETHELRGYNVLAASAHRKQAFVAHEDTQLTMIFATQSKNVGDAEDEFTDESHMLMSRHPHAVNKITITGE